MKQRPNIIVIFASAVLIAAVAVALLGNIFTPWAVTDQALLSRPLRSEGL